MSFSACNLLSSVKTAIRASFRGLDRLAIHNGGTGLWLFLVPLSSYFHTQGLVQSLPETFLSPQTEVMIDSLPGRQVARKHAPGTATLQDIENAIQNDSPAMFARATGLGLGWQVWSNFQPLGIIQVGRVNLIGFGHPASLPDFPVFG